MSSPLSHIIQHTNWLPVSSGPLSDQFFSFPLVSAYIGDRSVSFLFISLSDFIVISWYCGLEASLTCLKTSEKSCKDTDQSAFSQSSFGQVRSYSNNLCYWTQYTEKCVCSQHHLVNQHVKIKCAIHGARARLCVYISQKYLTGQTNQLDLWYLPYSNLSDWTHQESVFWLNASKKQKKVHDWFALKQLGPVSVSQMDGQAWMRCYTTLIILQSFEMQWNWQKCRKSREENIKGGTGKRDSLD